MLWNAYGENGKGADFLCVLPKGVGYIPLLRVFWLTQAF
jgi:hypothetical protein